MSDETLALVDVRTVLTRAAIAGTDAWWWHAVAQARITYPTGELVVRAEGGAETAREAILNAQTEVRDMAQAYDADPPV